jgi:hypothetical protein
LAPHPELVVVDIPSGNSSYFERGISTDTFWYFISGRMCYLVFCNRLFCDAGTAMALSEMWEAIDAERLVPQ